MTGGFSKLRHGMLPAPEDDPEITDLEAAIEGPPDEVPVRRSDRPDARLNAKKVRGAIVAEAFRRAAPPSLRRAIAAGRPVVSVVQAPSSAWMEAVDEYLSEARVMTIARAGSNKSIDVNQVGNEEVAKCLVAGRSFVGISTDPQRFLPTTLLLSADVTVKLVPPDAKSVRVLLRTLLPPMGRIPSSRIADTSGLDLNDLVSIFRSGSTASDALERLATLAMRRRQSSPHVEGAPILSNAIEFGGAAQIFGLNFVKDVQDWRQGSIQWAEADHGAILHSEPGHGKNFFVNSLALAAGTGLVVAKISDFFAEREGHLGASGQRGCLLAFDELDELPSRNRMSRHNADFFSVVVGEMLTSLDSVMSDNESNVGLCVLGMTNRLDAIDPALLRPGRFERTIEIPRPDAAGLANVLRYHLRGTPLEGADLSSAALLLEGISPAEAMEVARLARRAARRAGRPLNVDDLVREGSGPALPQTVLRRIAVHEAGHMVACFATGGKPLSARILNRGHIGGDARLNFEENQVWTLDRLENHIVFLLGGLCAEKVILGSVSTGAGGTQRSDLAICTSLLAAAFTSTPLLGRLVYRCADGEALAMVSRDAALAKQVDDRLKMLERRATGIVMRHAAAVVRIADALVARRYVSGDEAKDLFLGRASVRQPVAAVANNTPRNTP
ncbi:MAG: AAA family ATPase [Bradyrhizobium sp.]|uniref:AAA family ATPase n=1 Tax=Bradyrhizobium sp. TaxID=376 RepID=UPI001A3047F9|nr:AAA family ATPase [Bradyrhizobium sp.]MBJ7402721.1 AAA family ATPase [Bradyrhizobium sp.]